MDKNRINTKELDVQVLSSTKALYSGKATAVSSFNEIGPFDVLPLHENFISLIRDKVTVIGTTGQRQQINFVRGLLEVSENRVRVFVGI